MMMKLPALLIILFLPQLLQRDINLSILAVCVAIETKLEFRYYYYQELCTLVIIIIITTIVIIVITNSFNFFNMIEAVYFVDGLYYNL